MSLRGFILKYNPINRHRLNGCRKGLKKNVTIFASNCIGGLLYHDHGRRFLSPTINTRFDTPDFIRFVCNIEHYLCQKLLFIDSPETFPIALLDDIKVYFVHYHTNEDAEKKWNERIKRIDWENVFILTNDNDGVTYDEIKKLNDCPFHNVLVFTAREYPEFRCTFQLKQFAGEQEVGNTMLRSIFTGNMAVQEEFDFTAWFNQTKGSNLENYRKK